jgi:hypothetical protein
MIQNPHLTYSLGFSPVWIVVISAVMLLCHDPSRDFVKTDMLKMDGTAGIVKHHKETIHHFPLRPLMKRLTWIMNLIISVRGIGWNFGSKHDHAMIMKELDELTPSKETKDISITELKTLQSKFLRERFLRGWNRLSSPYPIELSLLLRFSAVRCRNQQPIPTPISGSQDLGFTSTLSGSGFWA